MRSFRLAVAWLWVAIPLGWGVYHSVKKALPLFRVEATIDRGPARPAVGP